MTFKFLLLTILFYFVLFEVTVAQINYSVTVNMPDPVSPPKINAVTVTAENKNLIIWQIEENQNINYYNIYRDGGISDNKWVLAGSVPFTGNNVFLDKTSLSSFRSYTYRIAAIDFCGNEIYSASEHKTIKLSVEQSNEKNNVLKWNCYEGFDVENYNIYSGNIIDDSLKLLLTVPPTSTTFLDNENSIPDVVYQVEAVAKLKAIKSNYKSLTSRSNLVSAKLVLNLTDSANAGNIIIFPNPMQYSSMVMLPPDILGAKKLYLCSMDGKIIYTQNINSNEFEINRGNLGEGVYLLIIKGEKLYCRKIMVGGIR